MYIPVFTTELRAALALFDADISARPKRPLGAHGRVSADKVRSAGAAGVFAFASEVDDFDGWDAPDDVLVDGKRFSLVHSYLDNIGDEWEGYQYQAEDGSVLTVLNG